MSSWQIARGSIHLGTTYSHCISIPFFVAIGVVHQHFLKFSLISSKASSSPSIRWYCTLNVVISVCHISVIDLAGDRLFAQNTLVHLVVHMHHTTMGASSIHKSPIFYLCNNYMYPVISEIQPNSPILPSVHYFACVVIFLHKGMFFLRKWYYISIKKCPKVIYEIGTYI